MLELQHASVKLIATEATLERQWCIQMCDRMTGSQYYRYHINAHHNKKCIAYEETCALASSYLKM